ncbi:MAG: glutathione S-transferase family protein [Pseudomonadota bacterium]|nr:glutathione S-transferase family protein [Pseudomonadota bacterium]
MILIGMFDSPFVRRVAVSMNLLGIPFEHRNWSVGKDFELIRQFNPLGRVPALVQPDGDTLVESAAILDFLDEIAGPEQALLPRSGEPRREALRIIAIAVGGAEKGVLQVYESAFRPPEKRYRPWVERCHTQTHAALAELDRLCQVRGGEWLIGNRISQADITATCAYSFLSEALAINRDTVMYPALSAVAERCELMPEFRSVKADWFAPSNS